ncbi:MAG: tetratricopeptide repeat protein [Nitrospina sp.]|nr:tetratricopeptide repeat protein [Nitrospina sp.]MBT3876810.1 tetratricopeptide repeat protein [Nitrospina sp.]MBT4048166.1 tetratricopeptide repeat protein [Nitrospina sp.]MBT4556852.1 tetratricopeptide repeat protein [Nitrospina sp.]MBT5349664.1 tetratricopeptide repeat protein [Nitrospina sp.]
MPGKIKALWYFCMVVVVAGFLMLAFKGEMKKAQEQSDVEFQAASENQKKIEEKTVQIDPIKLVRELNALGKYEEAVEVARKAGERNPDHAQIQTWWGISLVKLGKRDEAIQHFILAAKKDPTDEKAHLYWGLTLAMDRKFKRAIGHYRTVLEINPEHSNAYAYWGASLSAMDKLEEAVSKLEESLVLNRFNSQAYGILIDVLHNQRNYERAWKMVKKARSDNVSLPQDSIERLSKVFPEPS